MQVSQLRKLLPPRRPGDGRICDWVTPAVNRKPICFIAFQLAYCRDKLAPATAAPPTESRQQGPKGKQRARLGAAFSSVDHFDILYGLKSIRRSSSAMSEDLTQSQLLST